MGDQVRLDGNKSVGEIAELDGREAVVVFGSLTSRVKLGRLTKVGGPLPQRIEVRARPSGASDAPAITQVRTRIDVRGARVDEVVPEVQRLVDDGVAASLPSVEILHGKGTGALRQAIHAHLAERSRRGGLRGRRLESGRRWRDHRFAPLNRSPARGLTGKGDAVSGICVTPVFGAPCPPPLHRSRFAVYLLHTERD